MMFWTTLLGGTTLTNRTSGKEEEEEAGECSCLDDSPFLRVQYEFAEMRTDFQPIGGTHTHHPTELAKKKQLANARAVYPWTTPRCSFEYSVPRLGRPPEFWELRCIGKGTGECAASWKRPASCISSVDTSFCRRCC